MSCFVPDLLCLPSAIAEGNDRLYRKQVIHHRALAIDRAGDNSTLLLIDSTVIVSPSTTPCTVTYWPMYSATSAAVTLHLNLKISPPCFPSIYRLLIHR